MAMGLRSDGCVGGAVKGTGAHGQGRVDRVGAAHGDGVSTRVVTLLQLPKVANTGHGCKGSLCVRSYSCM